MSLETLTTRTSQVWLRVDGIIQVVTFPQAQESLEDARANVAAGFKVGLEQRPPLLVDIRGIQGMDRAARAYYSSAEVGQTLKAIALLIESPVSKVLANFFLGLNKASVPVRLFTSEEAALTWLKNFIE